MATNNNVQSEAAVRKSVRADIEIAHLDKIIGAPTNVTMEKLRKQVGHTLASIPTTQWGGQTGHLAMVLDDEEFRIATDDPDTVTTSIGAVAITPETLTNSTTVTNRILITNTHALLQHEKWMQSAIDRIMVE